MFCKMKLLFPFFKYLFMFSSDRLEVIFFLCKQEDEATTFLDVHTYSFVFAPMQW